MKSIINGGSSSSLRWALMSTPSSTCPFPHSFNTLIPCFNPLPLPRRHVTLTLTAFGKTSSSQTTKPIKQEEKEKEQKEVEVEEVEEELPWIQEKALDLVEFTGSVTQVIPGPRVPHTSLPWLIAPPLAFVGLTFLFAFLKTLITTLSNFNSPRHKRRQLVNKNAMLIKSIDDLFALAPHQFQHSSLQQLVNKTGFSMEEILRKYIRYALNEKPFDANLVSDLIRLRKASMLTDSQVAECLNEISRRIVKDKGPVVMDASGYTEKGFNRKLAVQALFGKVFYLSELPELCSRDSSLIVKEIFGVTDEDADQLRIHTLSNIGDMEALEKMAEDGSDLEDSNES